MKIISANSFQARTGFQSFDVKPKHPVTSETPGNPLPIGSLTNLSATSPANSPRSPARERQLSRRCRSAGFRCAGAVEPGRRACSARCRVVALTWSPSIHRWTAAVAPIETDPNALHDLAEMIGQAGFAPAVWLRWSMKTSKT